ncbi:hypothetical protein IKG02_02430 [Candidatus Saccharibacteria bacterium]|nr:hypothetical protein [Candidatus Saccharibacteria bacterium]
MGVIVTKEEDNNISLTNKINADLREKMARVQALEGDDDELSPEAAEYLENYEKTGRFTWVWFILIALAIASLVFIILF